MSISLRTQKMLWGRAANRCNFPNCRIELVIDATETDDEALVGDACHMVGDSEKGPRGNSDLSSVERDKYANLILLCKVHHKIVDDQRETFTVEKLKEIKTNHEKWVRDSLQGFDSVKQLDDERYASIVEEWVQRVELNEWKGWTYGLLNFGQPCIDVEMFKRCKETNSWIFSRIWPGRYPELEKAFHNFRRVLNDLLSVFERHIERNEYRGVENPTLWTDKFYRRGYGNPELERRLSDDYSFHVGLVQDLTLELTRAANYVCDKVREHLEPSFRLKEGVLLVIRENSLKEYQYRVEYQKQERSPMPYPGLPKFSEIRIERDFHVGQGKDDFDGSDDFEDTN